MNKALGYILLLGWVVGVAAVDNGHRSISNALQSTNKDILNIDESILELTQPTHVLLTKGGDARLNINSETGTNKYHSKPLPDTHTIHRSSCTSSTISFDAFVQTEQLRQQLITDSLAYSCEHTYKKTMHEIHQRILRAFVPDWHENNQPHCICTPSGSDVEMLFSLIALLRHPAWQNSTPVTTPLVTNIVVAAQEVGSGTVQASGLRHFDAHTPSGESVQSGSCISGIPDNVVSVIEIATRNRETGTILKPSDIEPLINHHVEEAIKQGQCVIVHAVDASKTGIAMPSFDFLQTLKQHYHDKIVIVVDAAQGRCTREIITQWLEAQFCVFLTGSKFFAGPPFSGVALLPTNESAVFRNEKNASRIPEGLGAYFTRDTGDERLCALQKALPNWYNWGMLLRWEAALYEIERFYTLDQHLYKHLASLWSEEVKQLVKKYQYIDFLKEIDESCQPTLFMGYNTIMLLTVHPEMGAPALDVPDLRCVHKWMAEDMSNQLPSTATDEERMYARQPCLIGQPVAIAHGDQGFGVIRIALSAPMVYNLASSSNKEEQQSRLKTMINQDRQVLAKLSLLGKYFYFLKS